MSHPDFDAVIQQGVELQSQLGGDDVVAVGGTAAALHCGHRYSLDVDCVTPRLREDYESFASRLEDWPGWRTNRKNPPVLILGEREGIELGVRQLRRARPLETTRVRGLLIPTIEEMLRIKAFLAGERRGVRDFIDLTALAGAVGGDRAIVALTNLNELHPSSGSQTAITRLAEGCEAEPADFSAVDLHDYKGIIAPFDDWEFVRRTCREIAQSLLRLELNAALSPPARDRT